MYHINFFFSSQQLFMKETGKAVLIQTCPWEKKWQNPISLYTQQDDFSASAQEFTHLNNTALNTCT